MEVEHLHHLWRTCVRANCEPVEWLFDAHTLAQLRREDRFMSIFSYTDNAAVTCMGKPFKVVSGPPPPLDFDADPNTVTIQIVHDLCLTLVGKRSNGRMQYFDHERNAEWAR